jgi:hypothetical protein
MRTVHMNAVLTLLLFLSFIVVTFERPTKVKLEGGIPPTFVLSGSGTLGDLVIYGPKQRDVGSDRNHAIWEIQPIRGFMNGEQVETIGTIKYGEVPQGYKQIYPANNAAPRSLVSGIKYGYWFQTVDAPHARASFEIRDGKAVEITE